jgi:hypothetical protein
MFEEVWQYGSNNNPGDANRDPYYEQDGVAPQCRAKDLKEINSKQGRAYTPPQNQVTFTKWFLDSHSIGNYGWIFTTINTGEKGYVKIR